MLSRLPRNTGDAEFVFREGRPPCRPIFLFAIEKSSLCPRAKQQSEDASPTLLSSLENIGIATGFGLPGEGSNAGRLSYLFSRSGDHAQVASHKKRVAKLTSASNLETLDTTPNDSWNINTPLLGTQQTLFRFIESLRA